MIAYHFPPLSGSSGVQRTLRFAQHLPQFGWEPAILTVSERAYERTSTDLSIEVPEGIVVKRAFAFDAARHLSVAGRYPGFVACPDRWATWRFEAMRIGMALVRKWRPQLLWSTYPIATAHVIGAKLQRRSGLPWVADFRDPMAQQGYPADAKLWQAFKRIEETAVCEARLSVFTTPGAAREYRQRYPSSANRITVLENGFDEESFSGLAAPWRRLMSDARPAMLLHSGVVYPSERDPTQLFSALRAMVADGRIGIDDLRIRFRAPGYDDMLKRMAQQSGVERMIELLPPISYRAALEEMTNADALLVLQASNCNEQIPAKLYEYLRAGRPIIALADPRGDTAGVMREAGLDTVAALDSAQAIAELLTRFVRERTFLPLPRPQYVASASRLGRTQALAELFAHAAGDQAS
jgi:glycosyltransferase involved in cell wall biosynthesis